MTASAPIALVCLGIGALSVGSRLGLAVAVMMLGFTLAAPMRDGNLDRNLVPLSPRRPDHAGGGARK